ncbi:MAG: TylF/MycF/NovP-related O-methyltransferase [Planctomycetota bacterium]
MKHTLRRIIYPIRKLAAKFVNVNSIAYGNSIIHKAATLVASEGIEGDYLEFGVCAGGTFINSYQVIKAVFKHHEKFYAQQTKENAAKTRRIGENMRFFAFDSFQGLPELDRIDSETSNFVPGKYACEESRFRENLVNADVPLDRVVTVAGWFKDTCTEETRRKHAMEKAAIIYVDCDLYASARTVLDFVRPLLTDGTIIIFDDWYCFRGNPNRGEQRAFNEWKATMTDWTFTEYQKEGPWRNSFIANKCNSD